jgi:hypothetical protein
MEGKVWLEEVGHHHLSLGGKPCTGPFLLLLSGLSVHQDVSCFTTPSHHGELKLLKP